MLLYQLDIKFILIQTPLVELRQLQFEFLVELDLAEPHLLEQEPRLLLTGPS